MSLSPLSAASVLLAAVLLVSAVAKLRSPQASVDAWVSLRLPRALRSGPAPRLLPWAEIVLAIALLFAPGALYPAAALAGLLVFIAYLVVVARALTFEVPVTCSCFGTLGMGAITRTTVVRNALLVLVSALSVADAFGSGSSVAGRLLQAPGRDWLWLALVVAAAVIGALIAHGSAPAAGAARPAAAVGDGSVDGAVGDGEDWEYERTPIPYGQLTHPDGTITTLRELAAGRAQLLVYLNLGCAPCLRVMEEMPAFIEATPILDTTAVLYEGTDPAAVPDWMTYLLDPQGNTSRTFQVVTPAAVLLGADGMLAGGPVNGSEQVLGFFADIRAELDESLPRETDMEAVTPEASPQPPVAAGSVTASH